MYDATALLPLAVGTFFVGEFNHQLVRLDFDPDDMRVDEDGILDLGDQVEVTPNRFEDEGFNLVSGDPADGPGLFGSALQQGGGEIVFRNPPACARLSPRLSTISRNHSAPACVRYLAYTPGGVVVTSKPEEYRAEALECEERAEQTRDPFIKQQLIEIAEKWRHMAAHLEKYSR